MSSLYEQPLFPGVGNTLASSLGTNYGATTNPFFTISNQFLPRNLHDVIRWVRYITVQSPVSTEVLRKLSTFPITSFTYSSDDEAVRRRYEQITKSFQLKSKLHDIGFQYFTAGNVFISIYFPVHRSLVCKHCNAAFNASNAEFLKFKSYKFMGTCPKCGNGGEFTVRDTKSTNIDDMNVVLWDPLNIVVNHNPISGKSKYYYKIPNEIKRQIQLGNMVILDSIPWEFVECVRDNKDFEFGPGRIYHMKNVDTGFSSNGVSIPPLVSHFGLVFYQATLRKANETIAGEFMAPLRVIFPQPNSANGDPMVSMSLANFRARMEEAFISHRRDKSHVLIAPVPIGYEAISGEGKTLLVAQEIQQAEESLLLSLGVSRELLSGSTNWTSSTVGLRMLKNTLDSYVGQVLEVTDWISTSVSQYLSIPKCQIGLTPFQLTDDDSLKSVLVGLMQSGQVSMTTVYEALGRSYDEEQQRMIEDAKSSARQKVRIEFETEQATYLEGVQVKKENNSESAYMEVLEKCHQMAQELSGTDPNASSQLLDQLKIQNFAEYCLVKHLLEKQTQGVAIDPATGQPMAAVAAAPTGAGTPQAPAPTQVDPSAAADQAVQEAETMDANAKYPPEPTTTTTKKGN